MAKYFFLLLVFSVCGGIAFLALSDVPAPTKAVVKPIPAERFTTR